MAVSIKRPPEKACIYRLSERKKDEARWAARDREFNSWGATTENAFFGCPLAALLWLAGLPREAPWRNAAHRYKRRWSFRYLGPKSFRALYFKTRTFNWAQKMMGSQHNSYKRKSHVHTYWLPSAYKQLCFEQDEVFMVSPCTVHYSNRASMSP